MNEALLSQRVLIQLREKLAPLPVFQDLIRLMLARVSLQARLLRTLRSTDVLDYIWRYRCGRFLGRQYSRLLNVDAGMRQ